MTIITSQSDIEEAKQDMEDMFSDPIRTVSEFYVLLYLSENENVDELDFDLFQLADKLKDSLWNYAVYVSAKEMGHANRQLRYEGVSMDKISSPRRYINRQSREGRMSKQEAEERVMNVKADVESAIRNFNSKRQADIIESILLRSQPGVIDSNITERRYDKDFKIMLNKYDAFNPDSGFIEAMQWIFSFDWQDHADETVDYMKAGEESGWRANYGGPAWGNVCETAALYTEFGRNSYCDIMLSVEHNNNNFLDKFPIVDRDKVGESMRRMVQEITSVEGWKQASDIHIYRNAMPVVLDLAKRTDLHPLFNVAKNKNRNLRGYRDLLPEKESEVRMVDPGTIAIDSV